MNKTLRLAADPADHAGVLIDVYGSEALALARTNLEFAVLETPHHTYWSKVVGVLESGQVPHAVR